MTERLFEFVFPELLEVPPQHRLRLLRQARDGEYDTIEWIGLIIAVVVTVLLTRYSNADSGWANRVVALFTNFVVAIPLLLVLAGPFDIRHTKRHLRRLLSIENEDRNDM